MKKSVLYFCLLFCYSCGPKNDAPSSPLTVSKDSEIVLDIHISISADSIIHTAAEPHQQIKVAVFRNESKTNGYGYDIVVNGKIMIHQSNIPAVSGNRGFLSESDATNAGELVKHKLLNNEMPPTISIDDLKALGIH